MKKGLITILIFYYGVSTAQVKDSLGFPMIDDITVGIQDVVTLDSVTKKDIQMRAKLFFVENFKSAKDVIQFESEDIIIGKGVSTIYVKSFMTIANLNYRFTIKIEAKDGKYRYRIENVKSILQGNGEVNAEDYLKYPKLSKDLRIEWGKDLKNLAIQLKEYMSKSQKEEKW